MCDRSRNQKKEKKRMSKRLFVTILFVFVAGSSVAWSQEAMRPGCDTSDPLTPGACFYQYGGSVGSGLIVDSDGDAFQGTIDADFTDFAIVKPNGTTQLHWQGQVDYDPANFPVGLLACRAGDFPACAFPPYPGLLVGSGSLLIAGEVDNPINIGVMEPFLMHATGQLTDASTGQQYHLTVNWVLSAAGLVVEDVKIQIAN
jgi:hypothetical protein